MHQLTWLGLALILIGLALVFAPLAAKYFDVERVPSWLLWVYHSGNVYFVTSPILLLFSLVSFILFLLRR